MGVLLRGRTCGLQSAHKPCSRAVATTSPSAMPSGLPCSLYSEEVTPHLSAMLLVAGRIRPLNPGRKVSSIRATTSAVCLVRQERLFLDELRREMALKDRCQRRQTPVFGCPYKRQGLPAYLVTEPAHSEYAPMFTPAARNNAGKSSDERGLIGWSTGK
jgi:hypothetical protein